MGRRNARRRHFHLAVQHQTSGIRSLHALRDATKVWYLTAWWKLPVCAAAAMYAHLVRNVIFAIVYRVHIFAEINAF